MLFTLGHTTGTYGFLSVGIKTSEERGNLMTFCPYFTYILGKQTSNLQLLSVLNSTPLVIWPQGRKVHACAYPWHKSSSMVSAGS